MITLYAARVGGRSEHEAAWALLSSVLGTLPEVSVTETGKPFFPHRPDLCFNLSHGGGWAVCALSPRPVGIDIQAERERPPVAWKKFTPEERDYATEDLPRRFYDLWVKKEAYLKYTGEGLTRPLSSFSVLPLPCHAPAPDCLNRLVDPPAPELFCAVCGEAELDPQWHIVELSPFGKEL